jgi:hypothetical protein
MARREKLCAWNRFLMDSFEMREVPCLMKLPVNRAAAV